MLLYNVYKEILSFKFNNGDLFFNDENIIKYSVIMFY